MLNRCRAKFPKVCEVMERALPVESGYRLHPDVPLSKVTIANSNPCPMHRDRKNVGITLLAAFLVAKGKAGSHVIASSGLHKSVVVEDAPYGMLTYGWYQKVAHGNLACADGAQRFVLTAYLGKDVAEYASKK